ncbi:MAG: RluA family pseudouridine synthase [Planctomycetota bacterium]|nr:RluA family pseudouridine synthase [Planctomycetota bacterium]
MLELGPEARGTRLDRALADALPEHSRSAIAQWIKDGRVRVDGEVLPGKHKVEGGEQIEIVIPPPRPATVEPEAIPIDVLHEDPYLVAVNKPTGLTVHPGSGQPDGTLANALVHHFRELPELIGSDRPGIVHRLDKDTSGVIVVAKTEPAQRALSAAFAERTVDKTYLACVHGRVEEENGEIDGPIGRAPKHRTLMAIREDGRPALTRWSVERRLPRHTLVACKPVTGRTHQLRVHLCSIHHPIVGDRYYGWKSAPGDQDAGRLLLHAWRIAFAHPVTGEALSIEAPVPADYTAALERLAALPGK